MTKKWMTSDEDFDQLHSRTGILAQHCSLMSPAPAQVRRRRRDPGEEAGFWQPFYVREREFHHDDPIIPSRKHLLNGFTGIGPVCIRAH